MMYVVARHNNVYCVCLRQWVQEQDALLSPNSPSDFLGFRRFFMERYFWTRPLASLRRRSSAGSMFTLH